MPKQTRPAGNKDEPWIPNPAANRDPAEGSREAVNENEGAGGITNRPLSEEEANQERVPPRGENKEGGHA